MKRVSGETPASMPEGILERMAVGVAKGIPEEIKEGTMEVGVGIRGRMFEKKFGKNKCQN